MLGSDYRELIVPRLDSGIKSKVILIAGIALTVLSLVLGLLSGQLFTLLLTTIMGAGTFLLWFRSRVEYEYIISGDELVVTKILAESKRKPMLTVSILKFTAFGPLKEAAQGSSSQTTVLACAAQDDTAFYADFDHDEYGQCRLVFTPNDDILEYLSRHIPRSLGYRFVPRENQ